MNQPACTLAAVPRRLALCTSVGALLVVSGLTPLSAQDRLFPTRSVSIAPVFERWSFGSGLLQPGADGGTSLEIRQASAFSVPISASLAIGERWTVDVSTAYSRGTVGLRQTDPTTGGDEYELSGLTDVRARLSGRFMGDRIVATVGANLPTGTTELDTEQYAALRVLAAPALAMQAPALGTGLGATAGVVLARQIGGWAWAFGASYELRRAYTPIAFATDVAGPDMNPGDAVHLTLGLDGLVGQSGMTLAVTTDLFGEDELDLGATGGVSGVTTKLGPIFTVDWQLRVAAPRLRELTVYAVDRYRTSYERGGTRVDESSGNYLDAGVRAVFPLSPSTGVLSIANLRHQTGLKSDSTLATAATAGAGATLGLVQSIGGGYTLQPFVHGSFAKIKNVDTSVNGTGLSAGITLGVRF